MNSADKKNIKALIARDKIEEALSQLLKYCDENDVEKELILNSARNNDLKRLIRNGVVSFEEIQKEKSNIRLALIELVNELEMNKSGRNQFKNPQNNLLKKSWLQVLILVLLVMFLLYYFSSSTTIGIQGDNNDNNKVEISK